MARTKKADSAINSFFTDTSKEMVERQETIVEKVVNSDSEPAAEKKAAASEGPPPERDRPRRPLLAAQGVPGGAPPRGLPQCERSHALAARGASAQGPLGRSERHRIEGKTEMTAFEHSAQGYRVAPYIADLGKKEA